MHEIEMVTSDTLLVHLGLQIVLAFSEYDIYNYNAIETLKALFVYEQF